jgi:3-(3-hydroxy-phenyl)propionate hydroxylase
MRPEGRGKYESLYFDYPVFESTKAPELLGEKSEHAVAVVGAGPIGLTTALELARHGIRSVVLDDKTTVNDGSRAVCLARHSLETLQQLGLHEVFTAKALGWTNGRSYYRGRQVYQLEMPHSDDERFFPMYNLQQQYGEQYLVEAAMEHPLVDVRWGSAVTAVANFDGGVAITVASDAGTYALRAQYCISADGARSAVRKSLGLALHGDAYEGSYVIADVRMKSEFPTERRAFFDPQANPGATLLVHKQPDDIWRLDWQLQAHEEADDAIAEAILRIKISAILTMLGETDDWELEWWSIYRAFTLCLDEYRHGNVLFAGDAAHLVPIFGVRGLNSGIADAANVGWKLAWVLSGRAPDALLDSYSPERRGATMEVFENAAKSTAFMTPPTRGFALMRDAALSLSLHHEFAKPFLNPRQATPYTYFDSPLSSARKFDAEFNAGPSVGAPLANVRLTEGDYFLDHLGSGFTVIVFGDDGTLDAQVAAAATDACRAGATLTCISVGTALAPDDTAIHIADSDGRLRSRLGACDGTCYLVRPDRHVAARWRVLKPDFLSAALRTAQGWAE